jgi:hypothetical protein
MAILPILRIIYPVVVFYFLVAASIFVDQQSSYEGLAFTIFAIGSVGTTYEMIFFALQTPTKKLAKNMICFLVLPIVLPFLRSILTSTNISIWPHAVESSIYLMIPTLPFLWEWIRTTKDKATKITMVTLSMFSLIQLTWFSMFLISESWWPSTASIETFVFYVALLTILTLTWIKTNPYADKN